MTGAGGGVRLPFTPESCPRCGEPVSGPPGTPCGRPECTVGAALDELRRRRRRRVLRGTERLRAEGIDPDAVTWSPTPYQPAPQIPVSDEHREELRARLETLVAAARAGGGEPEGASEPDEAEGRLPGPRFRGSGPVFAAACRACGGLCCREGLTRGAFLTVATLRRVRGDEGRGMDAGGLVDLYLAHLGPTHARSSCLFHGERGCRLPRELRSDTCNEWICTELKDLFLDTGGGDGVPPGHVFVAMSKDGRQVGGVARYEPPPEVSSRAKAASKAEDEAGKSTART